MNKLEIIGIIGICLVFILLSFGFGYRQGATFQAEQCLDIISSVNVDEINFNLNETEIFNMIMSYINETNTSNVG